MLRIMMPDQYPNYYKVLEIFNGCFHSLDIMILFSYPSSIVIMKDYCMKNCYCEAVKNCSLAGFCLTMQRESRWLKEG